MKKINTFNSIILSGMVVIFLALLFSCNQSQDKSKAETKKDKLKGTVSISGAFALYPMTTRWVEEFNKIYPKVRIDVSAGGAGKGMTDALSGMVDLGMFSRGVSQAEIDKGAWWIAVTKDAVLSTINASNPLLEDIKSKGVTKEQFYKIFITQELTTWGACMGSENTDFMNVYTRSDACGAAQMWGEYLGKDQESLNGVGVFGDPGMANAIQNDKLGIGFNNTIYIYDINTRKKQPGLEVVPIDLNENGQIDPEEYFYDNFDDIINAIQTGIYPSPPARDLYFVSKGKPQNPVTVEFLKWILTDGQQYVSEGGYVQLSQEKIQSELLKLE